MAKKDPRVDKYLKNAPSFAQPIFKQMRKIVWQSCPQVEESMKWDQPFFLYDGKILCGMGTFKAHCKFWIWNWKAIVKNQGEPAKVAMKQLYRIENVADLPSPTLLKSLLKQAVKFREAGVNRMQRAPKRKPPVKTPPELMRALRAKPKALAIYEKFSPTHQRHYVDWITDAKTEETRIQRLEKAVKAIAAGKKKHWEQ